MVVKLALALAALLGVLLLLRWMMRAPPERVARFLRRGALYAAAGALILLAATGRLHWLFATLGALVAMLPRLIWYIPVLGGLYKRYRAYRSTMGPRGSRGQSSRVETRFVRMSLDHESGEIDGMVLDGRFKGARLSELALEQLLDLWRECRVADEDSAQLVEAFLDRSHGESWRAAAGGDPTGGGASAGGAMTADEAREILGVGPAASKEDIIAAHRRLMQKLHPDRGGSAWLAARINQAKDVLLKGKTAGG